MSQLFSLSAHVCGSERSVSAEADGFGITVSTSGGPVRARSTNDAVRLARDDIGEHLRRAERRSGVPWGLRVSVGGIQAVYGEWPLIVGGGEPEASPVSRIRNRWDERSGPLSALANAIEIIRAYLPRGRGGLAA
jgi:hypothetical protein